MTERKQVGLPGRNGSALTPAGPTLTTSVNYAGSAGLQQLYRVADRKTPAMADGSMHGLIGNLTQRGANFDGTVHT